jgi:hypothetical protein
LLQSSALHSFCAHLMSANLGQFFSCELSFQISGFRDLSPHGFLNRHQRYTNSDKGATHSVTSGVAALFYSAMLAIREPSFPPTQLFGTSSVGCSLSSFIGTTNRHRSYLTQRLLNNRVNGLIGQPTIPCSLSGCLTANGYVFRRFKGYYSLRISLPEGPIYRSSQPITSLDNLLKQRLHLAVGCT